jgi:hypothetical protein
MGEERLIGYIKGYSDGRIDAKNDVEAALNDPEHTDTKIIEAALGLHPSRKEAVDG